MKIRASGLFLSLTALTGCLFANIIPSVPGNWPTHYPEWWYDADPAKSMIDISSLDDPGNQSPILQGQLLHMADVGIQELNEQLAPIGGAGFTVDDFRDPNKTPAYYSPAAVGQLKFVASKFYNRFAAIGYQPGSTGWNPSIVLDEGQDDNSPLYPWKDDQTPENLSLALIGQAKFLFSWDLSLYVQQDTNPVDGIPDWHIVFAQGLDPDEDYDQDGASNSVELIRGTDPINPLSIPVFFVDTDMDFLDDRWEVGVWGSLMYDRSRDSDGDSIPDYMDSDPSDASSKILIPSIITPSNGAAY